MDHRWEDRDHGTGRVDRLVERGAVVVAEELEQT